MRNAVLLVLALAAPGNAGAGPFALEGSRRPAPVRAMAAAPDGTVLGVTPDGVVRLDPASRSILRTYVLPAPDDAAFIGSVAAHGADVLIGVPYTLTISEEERAGAAYLLDGATGEVRHVFTSPLPPPSPTGNNFGLAVATLGDDVLVGAPFDHAAYRFDGATGRLEQTDADPGPGTEPFGSPFGTTVLGIGDAVIVGAPIDAAVHVFDADTGALRRTISDPRPGSGPYSFGAALAALGPDLLVGGPLSGLDSPGAAAWAFDPETGTLLRTFTNPLDPRDYTQFGQAIAAADGFVVVGDPNYGVGRIGEDLDGYPSVGRAYVFDGATGALLQTVPNPTSLPPDLFEDERFGAAVAAVPGRVVVGDPSDYPGSSLGHGGLYAYVGVAGCGDDAVGPLEVCDDGNLVDGDGCDSHCRPTACGNGVVSQGETCDDGNSTDGDGCDSNYAPTAATARSARASSATTATWSAAMAARIAARSRCVATGCSMPERNVTTATRPTATPAAPAAGASRATTSPATAPAARSSRSAWSCATPSASARSCSAGRSPSARAMRSPRRRHSSPATG